MPMLKLQRIVSCSSQDPAYPAENLLQKNSNKKWKCKLGEGSATIVFQLEKSALISGIDIGNEGSAFIEVLVGRESVPDDFKVILVMSSFMTPMDARNESEKNRVRIFREDHLHGPVASEKWDRVKVVCTQPFNKHMQYGLAFIKLHEPDEGKDSNWGTPTQLGRFTLKDDDDDDISVGSIFARRKEQPEPPPVLPPPAATSWKDVRGAGPSPKAGKAKNTAKNATPNDTSRKRPVDKDNASPKNSRTKDAPSSNTAKKTPGTKKQTNKDDEPSSPAPRTPAAKRQHSDEGMSGREKKQAKMNPNVIYKPFNKLMEGVEFAISGYANPGRADIRSRALEMGARYRPDWTPTCTHLVCAFANTPKFQQVKGKGKIVLRNWVDDCHKERKVLPWRRYAVDKADQTAGTGSDEKEIWELVEERKNTQSVADRRNAVSSESTSLTASQDDSGSDTEDEIDRIVQQKQRAPVTKAKDHSNGVASDENINWKKEPDDLEAVPSSVYDVSTDCDSDEEQPSSKKAKFNNLPELPSIFSGKRFYVHPSLPKDRREEVTRYITAFCGTFCEKLNKDVHFVIAERRESVSEGTHGARLVRPDWVWECNDSGRVVPVEDYEL